MLHIRVIEYNVSSLNKVFNCNTFTGNILSIPVEILIRTNYIITTDYKLQYNFFLNKITVFTIYTNEQNK